MPLLFCGQHSFAQTTDSLAQASAEPKTAASIYGEGVRSTPWLEPEKERLGFHLPPGFEIRLFASEPQIAKPLNIAFDEKGTGKNKTRVWLTQSIEYPYPSTEAEPSDAVMVLEDSSGDGTADRVTKFADKLNIPIGILPYGDGCLCFSIPNILYLRDTDNDGVCDRREVVLGPFDTTRDTHGMVNALRDGGDGWIYACHGFNNQSEVTGKDGHTVKMSSGNTFRFRPDGSRIEVVTHGQVNPFGMTQDHWGFFYSADCHSKPITQLLRGGCYPSFGRPHDGLGFVPPTVEHLHGSTAICGIVHFGPDSSIVPLRNQLLSGNVMTSRINRNRLSYQGATAVGTELGDFLTSDDPWFRPVDLRLGPDECIYVTDFYNRIIGHYEVPLDHPGRDRTSGRIWQIRYVGDKHAESQPPASNTQERIAEIHALRRTGKIETADLLSLCKDHEPRIRVEAIRQLAANDPPAALHSVCIDLLADSNAFVVQAAAEALRELGNAGDVATLLEHLGNVDADDVILRQTFRITMRDILDRTPATDPLWREPANAELASILLGLSDPKVSEPLLAFLRKHPNTKDRSELLSHLVNHVADEDLSECIEVAKSIATDQQDQWRLLETLVTAQGTASARSNDALADWAEALVASELGKQTTNESPRPTVTWTTSDGTMWGRRARKVWSENQTEADLVDSITRGERYTGTLRSDRFAAPQSIHFWLAGHNGHPDEEDHRKNGVRLVDSETGRVVKEAFPPRNDTAYRVRWDLTSMDGRPVHLECVDGDNGSAYAWLAIGGFEPAWVMDLESTASLQKANQWIHRLRLKRFEPPLEQLVASGNLSPLLELDFATTLCTLRGHTGRQILLSRVKETPMPRSLQTTLVQHALADDPVSFDESAQKWLATLTARQQRDFAAAWSAGGGRPGTLLDWTQQGLIGRAAIADANVSASLLPRLDDVQKKTFERLTADVQPQGEAAKRLAKLQDSIDVASGNASRGGEVFKKHCMNCHQLRGKGVVVGPQLDGAVTRTAARLLEDILTPDQNVDKAFRSTSFLLDDGRVLIGLVRAEDDQQVTIVDNQGKEHRIEVDEIERRKEAGRSLMPSNLGESISDIELSDLLKFIRQ